MKGEFEERLKEEFDFQQKVKALKDKPPAILMATVLDMINESRKEFLDLQNIKITEVQKREQEYTEFEDRVFMLGVWDWFEKWFGKDESSETKKVS